MGLFGRRFLGGDRGTPPSIDSWGSPSSTNYAGVDMDNPWVGSVQCILWVTQIQNLVVLSSENYPRIPTLRK